MRLLHIVPRYYPYTGGSELYVQKISEALAVRGHTVTVLTTNAWDLEYFWDPGRGRLEPGEDQHNGVTIVRLPVRHWPLPRYSHRAFHRLSLELARLRPSSRLSAQVAKWWVRLPELPGWLRHNRRNFDLAHVNNLPFDTLLLETLEAFEGVGPVVCTPHTHFGTVDARGLSYYTLPHQVRALQRCSVVFAQTPYEAGKLAELGIDDSKIRLAGVGVDPSEVTGGDGRRFRERYGLSGFLVGFLGTAAFEKGAIHLLEAMARLRARGHSAQVVFAGPVMSDFQRRATELVGARGLVLGHVDTDTKRDFLAAIDVLAMPSRTEAFGIVYLEAWANGKPVVGARAGAVTTVIRDGIDGMLVDFGDVDKLAQALETLMLSPALREAMGQAGRERALREYRWQDVIARVSAGYCAALGLPKGTL